MILLSLAIAAFWGAAHALTPGHGKAIVAGYLVGTKGTARRRGAARRDRDRHPHDRRLRAGAGDAPALAVHRPGGAVPLADAGVRRPRDRSRRARCCRAVLAGAATPTVITTTTAIRTTTTRAPHPIDRRGLLGVGVAAGLLPCPSALVVLLSAIALHRIGFGLALIVAFSLGLAATITSIGLVAVLAKRAFSRLSLNGPVIRLLPAASALVILAVGVGITLKALPEVL